MPNMLIEGVVQIVPKVGMAMRLYLLMHIDAHNSHKPHQIVKKIYFFDQNNMILGSYFSFLRMDKTKWDGQ